jgi:AAHS family 4-hydroxybenzoate transporter-like MFS transporter
MAGTTFSEAMSRRPMRTFQWLTVAVCMLVLVCDGIDMQLLGIVAPLVIPDFGVDRGTFGIAMSAALIGFGLGAWGGGRLGDGIGRRYALALAAFIFALATVGASQADGVWHMAAWRIVGGLGFGAAYANAIAMASEWLPERLRPVMIATLSVGTPLGGTVVGALGPGLAAVYGWRGAFVVFGAATLVLVIVILLSLRDSPSFLLAKGKTEQAKRAARLVLDDDVTLAPERHGVVDDAGMSVGVLHRTNTRFNTGVGIAFAASALCAYGILNWSTTFLTAHGFTLPQAGNAVSIGGIMAMIGSVLAGMLSRRFGTRIVMAVVSGTLFVNMLALGFAVQTLPAVPVLAERWLVVALLALAGAIFSAGMATMYIIMSTGYPQSCRSAGIGFGIFMSRVGAISASGFGGWLLDIGHGSVVPFFAVLSVGAVFVSAGAFIVDRHVVGTRGASRARTLG